MLADAPAATRDLAPDAGPPGDTRAVGARCSRASGGLWGGCVYDADAIVALLDAGREALAAARTS